MSKTSEFFITQISGKPGSGQSTTTFRSGAVSRDIKCAQFFMTMQDRGKSLEEMRNYAQMGPILSPDVDWDEIKRVLSTFRGTSK